MNKPKKKFKEEEWEGITYVRKEKNLEMGEDVKHIFIKTERGTQKCNFKRGTKISELVIKSPNCWFKCNNRLIED